MLSLLKKLIIGSLLYGIILYALSTYIPELGFAIVNNGQYSVILMLLLVWLIFFLVNRIIKRVIMVFKLPLNILTLWFGSLIINVLMLYIFIMSINYLTQSTGISIQVGNMIQIVLLALILSIVDYVVQTIQ